MSRGHGASRSRRSRTNRYVAFFCALLAFPVEASASGSGANPKAMPASSPSSAPGSTGAGSTPAPAESAEALFDRGFEHWQAKRFDAAASLLLASLRKDPAMGTQFYLADCYEQMGKLALAYRHFAAVAANAKLARQEQREIAARERAGALAPLLGAILIVLDPSAFTITDLALELDGQDVTGEIYVSPAIAVEPGEHELTIRARKMALFRARPFVKGPRDIARIVVPKLDEAREAALRSLSPRALGTIFWGASSGALLAVGVAATLSLSSGAEVLWKPPGILSLSGLALGGASLLGAGAYALLGEPSRPASVARIHVRPFAAPDVGGVLLFGQF